MIYEYEKQSMNGKSLINRAKICLISSFVLSILAVVWTLWLFVIAVPLLYCVKSLADNAELAKRYLYFKANANTEEITIIQSFGNGAEERAVIAFSDILTLHFFDTKCTELYIKFVPSDSSYKSCNYSDANDCSLKMSIAPSSDIQRFLVLYAHQAMPDLPLTISKRQYKCISKYETKEK